MREPSDRVRSILRPEFDGHASVDLPRDPRDVVCLQRAAGILKRPLLVEGHQQILTAEDRWVDGDPIALDDPAFLEPPNPISDRRGGEGDPPPERLEAATRVLVQFDEQAEVLLVHARVDGIVLQELPASMACRRSSRAMDADPMTSGGPSKDRTPSFPSSHQKGGDRRPSSATR